MAVMRIGSYSLRGALFAAPMAGVTDAPFRRLCRRFGADVAVSEMISANPRLRHTAKSVRRCDHAGEPGPIVVQIAGADPIQMSAAARYNVERGAQIIDINMGCPAKKVCNAQAGSALLADEGLVARILDAVVAAVDVPVTLKIRTGTDARRRNAQRVAQIAEQAGVAALAIHGRTRACAFRGVAEHDTTRDVKRVVSIPVIANGDIRSARDAARVLAHTGADGVMIGRAAQGNPWIFREVAHFLRSGRILPPPGAAEVAAALEQHLQDLYGLYGEATGVRVARKHLSWYCAGRSGAEAFWRRVNRVETAARQLAQVRGYFSGPEAAMGLAA